LADHYRATDKSSNGQHSAGVGLFLEKGNAMHVLLVEDSPGDVRLTLEAFADANPAVDLFVVVDGVEAMTYLKREGVFAQASRPDLILLDLNMPKMNGRQVLAEIKKDESLKLIPTVILTTSNDETDVAKCFQLQANSYLCKPVDLDGFNALVRSINDFWLAKSRLPQPEKMRAFTQANL
jgi:CheY-like chemotaxis protein